MSDVEQMLRRDRNAGVPAAPDTRYTMAAIQRRMGKTKATAHPSPPMDRLMLAAGVLVLIGLATLLLLLELTPWWLLLLPLVLGFALLPVLRQKGV